MKNIIIVIVITIITFMFPSIVLAGSAVLSLDPTSGTFNQGCSFSLNINIDTGGAQTGGVDAIVQYVPSVFTVTSVTKGTIFPDYPINNTDNSAGKVSISGYSSSGSTFSGKGVFATINFTVASSASGASQITFDFDPNNKSKTTDSNVAGVQQGIVVDMLDSVVNGSYTVGTGTCGAQVTPSPSPVAQTTIIQTQPIQPIQPGGAGGVVGGTPSAQYKPLPSVVRTLPNGGTQESTFAVAIIGGVLTVLGILGLALL